LAQESSCSWESEVQLQPDTLGPFALRIIRNVSNGGAYEKQQAIQPLTFGGQLGNQHVWIRDIISSASLAPVSK
jgi:hypothetical protein